MQLKIYQENAIEGLLEKAKKLLGYSGEKKLVFKAPTGSGKTIMMAEFLKQLINDPEFRQPLSFIWTAPRHLHEQSKGKLEKYYQESRALRCSFFEDLEDRKIDEKEILFFNWESINKADNIYIRENEQDLNLSKVLENTKEEGRKIILIIDESHFSADAPAANRLRKDIYADLTIEVSATPVLEGDETVNVHIEDVKAEGMIKKAVVLNEDFINKLEKGKIKTELGGGSEGMVIKEALKKREELLKAYEKEKTDINPLILIQLPDRIGSLEDRMKEKVISILEDNKISTENGKLAIWLSGEHVNKENVERKDSEVEILIFKQAIALGWDCPRAQILVLFREWHSPIFSIQTVGRIMRMPEPDKGHYLNSPALNLAYVYTNLNDIEIREDIAKGYITTFESKRREDYQPINLTSYYPKRHREKTRLSPLFIQIFLDIAKKRNLKKKIDLWAQKLDEEIISDWRMEEIDKAMASLIRGRRAKFQPAGYEFQRLFDFFVRKNLSPFYPEDRSVGRIKEAIYRFFQLSFGIDFGKEQEKIIKIVLSGKNERYFIEIIEEAKDNYIQEVSKKEKELVSVKDWNIPESLRFNSEYIKEDKKKSIMQPFFTDEKWKPEKAFIKFLDNSKKVKWWFKNGERDATFFAVPFKNEEWKPFYVDFIVRLKDGKIGLFDTKAGFTQKIAGPKIDGLYKYIQEENKKKKGLFGGIIINADQRNYRGRWIYFDKSSKNLKDDDFSDWKDLEL